MNRILLSLCALMLSASVANAQYLTSSVQLSKQNMVTAKAGNIQLRDLTAPVQVMKSLAPQKLNANQKSVGVDGSGTMAGGIGLPSAGSKVKGVYNVMDASDLADFKGAKIVGARYLIFASLGSSANVELYTIEQVNGKSTPTLYTSTAASSQKLSPQDQTTGKFDQQWNEVTFDKALDVNDVTSGLVLGYTYKQKSTQSGGKYTDECYPIAAGSGTSGVLAYGDLGQGTGWYQVSNEFVICIQLIVEKEGGFPDDLNLVGVATDPMFRPTDKLPLQFYVKNKGSKDCTAASFDITIDKNVVANVAIPEGATIGGETTGFKATLDLSEYGIENGTHLLGVQVKTVNGEAPSGNTNDDVASTQFRIYSETASRQYNLLEHFTSISCTYCPLGYDMLRALQKQRDDVAWVAIHSTKDESFPDPYEIADATKTIVAYSMSGWPQANLNRFPITNDGNLAVTIATDDPEGMATSIGNVFDQLDEIIPSQVKLDIEANFTSGQTPSLNPGTLKITVKGKGVKGAGKILEDAVLGLYITENGEESKQLNGSQWISKYKHENVLRVIGTDNPWGDAITWDGDNFEKTYEIEIPKKTYDYSKGNTLNAVAFVSLPFLFENGGKLYANGDLYNVWVNQCQFLQIAEGASTAIKGVETSENATVVARYAADGSQISAPVKGINILKMSDGTTRKVVVK